MNEETLPVPQSSLYPLRSASPSFPEGEQPCEGGRRLPYCVFYFSTLNIQHSTFNIQHSTFNIQLSTLNYSSKSPPNTSIHGSPCLLSCSMNGSGSKSSTFHTPGFFHMPLKNIMAPIMAGTPVVYDTPCMPVS